jgi:hypothetical protein
MEEIEALVAKVCAAYQLKPPEILPGNGRRSACYQVFGHSIKLPLWARNKHTVLHEVAHAVIVHKGSLDYAHHGPEFARLFLDMLDRFGGVKNIRELRRLAKKMGVKFATSDKVPQPIAARTAAKLAKIAARRKELNAELEELYLEEKQLLLETRQTKTKMPYLLRPAA